MFQRTSNAVLVKHSIATRTGSNPELARRESHDTHPSECSNFLYGLIAYRPSRGLLRAVLSPRTCQFDWLWRHACQVKLAAASWCVVSWCNANMSAFHAVAARLGGRDPTVRLRAERIGLERTPGTGPSERLFFTTIVIKTRPVSSTMPLCRSTRPRVTASTSFSSPSCPVGPALPHDLLPPLAAHLGARIVGGRKRHGGEAGR